MTAAAIVLIWLGAANAILAMTVETCTGGSADSLMGGLYTFVLYAVGLAILIWRRPGWLAYIALVPPLLVAVWHSYYAVLFGLGYWLDGASACSIMPVGFSNPGLDGREPFMTVLWGGLSLLIWAGIGVSCYRSLRRT
ncbi:hypothetical protein [Aminobacter ciceronei]|jgi:hypothetical protein|uniref:hypothetical protein n=1 Tax=Aminobacter ciceronei TaxID=150723 RepID=UPI003F70E64A